MWKTPRRDFDEWPVDPHGNGPFSVVVANSKIYLKDKNVDGLSYIAVLSAETGETLSTLTLNLGGPLWDLQGPEGRGVMEPVKWIAIRTLYEYADLSTEQIILILNLETNEVRTIYLTPDDDYEQVDINMIIFKDFLYIKEGRLFGYFNKLFGIASGELLYHSEQEVVQDGVNVDLGEGVVHLVGREDDQVAIVTFNSSDHTPKTTLIDEFSYSSFFPCDYQIVFSSFIRFSGNPLKFEVKPFGNGCQPRTRKNRMSTISIGVENQRLSRVEFLIPSKAILLVESKKEGRKKSLVLLDFAI